MADNPIATTFKAYKEIVPNPAVQSLLLAAIAVPVAYAAKKPFYATLRNVAADPRAASLLGMSTRDAVQGVDQLENDFVGKHVLPWMVGLTPAAVSAFINADSRAKNFGLDTWEPYISPYQQAKLNNKKSLAKTASLFQTAGYQPQLDFSQQLNRYDAVALMQNNPILQQSSYASNLGTSIITAAPYTGAYTTLGGVYDSAVNKFQKKLQYQGLGSKMLKGAISGSLAGMFTDVVGTIFGMPQPLRRGISNSVGAGKALFQILT